MTQTTRPSKVKGQRGRRKPDLAVPSSASPCRHETLLARIKIPVNEYVCDDCKEKLVLVVPQYGLMTPKEFEQFKRVQVMAAKAAERRQKTGLLTAEEYRQEQAQAQQKEGKR